MMDKRSLNLSLRKRFIWVLLCAAILVQSVELYPQEASDRSKILKFVYNAEAFSDVRLKDVEIALEIWSNKVSKEMDSSIDKVTADVLKGPPEIKQALLQNQVDVVILGPLEYFELNNDNLLRPALVPLSRGKPTLKYFLLAHKQKVSSLEGLIDRKILVDTGGHGQLPVFWLNTVLMRRGFIEGTENFIKCTEVDKASNAVYPVFFGKADACVVSDRSFVTLCELNPQLSQMLLPLAESPELLRGMVCFHRDLEEERKSRTKDVLLKLHENPEGEQILMIFREEKLALYDPEYLENTLMLINEHNALKKNQVH